MTIDPFCLFRTLGLCKEPPVELTQPEWWTTLPGGGAPGAPNLMNSIRLPQQQQQPSLLLLQQQQQQQQQALGQPFDAVDVRESATEVYCMQAAAATFYLPPKQQQQQQQLAGLAAAHSRAYAPAAAAANYPSSSRSSSEGQTHVPGFFGDLPIGKSGPKTEAAAAAAAADKWGAASSTEPSSRETSGKIGRA